MDKQPRQTAVENAALKEMTRIAEESLIPQMRKSAFVIAYTDSTAGIDIWLAFQVGFAVMFHKPLIVMTTEDFDLPARLALIADEVVKVKSPKGPDARMKLKAAIGRLLEKLERK